MKPISVAEIQAIIKDKIPEGLVVPAHDDAGHHYKYTPTGQVFDSVTTQMAGVVDNPHLKVWSAKLAVEHFSSQVILDQTILLDSERVEQLQEASVMVHRDTFENAGQIGTVGHSAVEKYILRWIATNIQPKAIEEFISGEDSREWAILRSAEQFTTDYYFIPVASELLVCSVKDGHAGTLDCLGFIIIPQKKCTTVGGYHNFWHASTTDWRKQICHRCKYKATYQLALVDWKSSNQIAKKPTYCAQVSAYGQGLKQLTGIKTDVQIIVRLDKKQAKYEVLKVSNPAECYKAFKQMQKLSKWLNSKEDHAEVAVKKEIISLT